MPISAVKVELKPSFTALGVRRSARLDDITSHMPSIMAVVGQVIAAQGLHPIAGFNMTLGFNPATGIANFMAGQIIKDTEALADGEVEVLNMNTHKAAIVRIEGDYDQFTEAFSLIRAYAETKQLNLGRMPYYCYLNDPSQVSSEAEQLVELVWPVV